LELYPFELPIMGLEQPMDRICIFNHFSFKISNFIHTFTCYLRKHKVHVVRVNIQIYHVFIFRF
jgi:hypothetical protein